MTTRTSNEQAVTRERAALTWRSAVDPVGSAFLRAGDLLTRLGWRLIEGTGWSIADNSDAAYVLGLSKGMSLAVEPERPREEYETFLERAGIEKEEAAAFLDRILVGDPR